jgi:hypothetical protein
MLTVPAPLAIRCRAEHRNARVDIKTARPVFKRQGFLWFLSK